MTRRDLMLVAVGSTAAPLALLWPGRALPAAGPIKGAGKGTIYVYAWEGGDGRHDIVQGIFALDPERSTWTRVAGQSDSAVYDTYFRVSHDGRFLAFARRIEKKPPDDVVGVSIRDLARAGELRKLDAVKGAPIWSPDGKQLLVAVGKGDVPGTAMSIMETWLVNADGSNPRKLPIPETDAVDDWSPDGSWVLAGCHRDEGVGYQIYRMHLDGTEPRRLTTTGKGVLNLDGRISPDGRQIAYFRIGDRQSGIWVMDADGSNPRQLFKATEAAIPGGPSWSPDSQKIAISVHAESKQKDGSLEEFHHQLLILDLAGAAPVSVAPPLTTGLGPPQWAAAWKS